MIYNLTLEYYLFMSPTSFALLNEWVKRYSRKYKGLDWKHLILIVCESVQVRGEHKIIRRAMIIFLAASSSVVLHIAKTVQVPEKELWLES